MEFADWTGSKFGLTIDNTDQTYSLEPQLLWHHESPSKWRRTTSKHHPFYVASLAATLAREARAILR